MAQPCTNLGQNPSSAFPVCGTSVFSQSTVPLCPGQTVPGPCNGVGGSTLTDINPYWYRFTCFTSGSLGFVITPNDLNDDYDWQLFDITGRNPNDVYTDASLFVSCNWSGNSGTTGASAAGIGLINCAGYSYPTFSSMANITQGHTYLLLISHFTNSQSGYGLSFTGGTASITDPLQPDLSQATSSCDGSTITVVLNKPMKCSSLAGNGSDFSLSSPLANISSAGSSQCASGFDMDTLVLNLSNPLPPGTYTLTIKNGSDGNTIADNCDREIPAGNNISFTVLPKQSTPLDSIAPLSCAPKTLDLVFQKNIRCNSIASNGSDFLVTGPYPVTVLSAGGNCVNGLSNIIHLNLTAPIVHAGTYTIELVTGSDGNTIIDECGEATPAGSTISFSVKDTVSAAFSYQILEGCRFDTILLNTLYPAGIETWNWNFDNTIYSTLPNPQNIYSSFGNKNIQLIVSNGFCSDTTNQDVFLPHDSLQAEFTGPLVNCPGDLVYFVDSSIGKIIAWNWTFGNGFTSTQEYPLPQQYPQSQTEKQYPVQLIITSDKYCYDTIIHFIKVAPNCYIDVPTAFTPNNDGLNDFLYPLNAYKAANLEFKVFNRYGQLIFKTRDWTRKWDGNLNGIPQPSGVYVWYLQYTNTDTGDFVFKKGTTVLIR
ncbi:MAG: gliding motility-associated C-terminal domain-containing protein [Bacteroidetes bacterium]|nr:gliding motility-associated C-terminal domain-containing protein [Bacteroidota bacterium]